MEYTGNIIRIRKLTPVECWRLMGWGYKDDIWHDDDFKKAEAVCSNTQLYKQAGNGIVCSVIESIARQMRPHVDELHLTELFGGIGCQRKGFVDAGISVFSCGYVDFDKYATASYNAIYGEEYEPTDVTKVKGTDLYAGPKCMWTYSFPCTDLSVAGRGAGMAKGSGTRSGLLWEVERILRERVDAGLPLPDFLLMENVTQVHGKKNVEHFEEWIRFLESIGYHNKWKDLNAKDFGIAQNRNRTFMLSSLDPLDWFEWPEPIELTTCMADYLDEEVDEKYYIKSEKADKLISKLIESGEIDEFL